MSTEAIITLAILLGTVVCLIREWLPVGLAAILAPLVLVLLKVLEPKDMWAGLAHPAVVAVAAMFVVSTAVSRTGALSFLADGLSRVAQRGQRSVLVVLLVMVAAMSAFTNNTTVVLICLPVVLTLCDRTEQPPSRLLIPLSFASIFGGMMTLVGTSTNIVVAEEGRRAVRAEYGDQTLFDPGMWDFAPMGGVFLVAGLLYLVMFSQRLLPDRAALSMTLSKGVPSEYFTEAEIKAGSSLVGKQLGDVVARYKLRVIQLIRDAVILRPDQQKILREGDVLLLKGAPNRIADFSTGTGADLLPDIEAEDVTTRGVDMTMAELIVPPRSRWLGRPVSEIAFRSRYGVSVIAVQRHGHHVRQKVGELRVEPADMLLVQGTLESLRNLRLSENFILIEGAERDLPSRKRAPVALAILAGFILLVATGLLDIATGAVVTAAAMVLFRCLTAQQAFDSFDWNVLFMLAGFLGLGVALEKVGLAHDAAEHLMGLLQGAPGWIVIGTIYLLTAFLSDLLSNTAVAALMVPIVVQAAHLHQARPEPFVMAVAFAASAAFLTPLGYQTNLLVFGPGGYQFKDFIKIGLPLRISFIILAAAFIPYFYPL